MEAFVGFHFMFDYASAHPEGRHFVIKFDVTPDARLAAIWRRQDNAFEERLNEFFDDDIEIYGEDWATSNLDLFGWLTHDLDEDDDPLPVVEKVRGFFLKEGFLGGEIVEVTDEEFDKMAEECASYAELEAALIAFISE